MSQEPRDNAIAWKLSRFGLWLGTVLAVVALGLFVRFVLGGPVGDFLGGVLYTVLVAVLVLPLISAILRHRMPRSQHLQSNRHWIAAGVALAISVLVELLQLSSIPEQISTVFPPARLVFGTTFSPIDLAAYCSGALLAGLLGALWRVRSRVGGATLGSCDAH